MLLDLFRGGFSLENVIPQILAILAVSFLMLPMHECAHALAAHWLGDDTAKHSGRMTLNPFAHIDPFGMLALFFVGFGWAKPVPINPWNFKNRKAGMALSALAGPVSNLLAAFIGCILHVALVSFGVHVDFVSIFFSFFVQVNIYLAVFNLLPIPPLDGSKFFTVFLPEDKYFQFINRELFFVVIIIIVFFSSIFHSVINFFFEPIWDSFYAVAQFIFGLS